MSTLQTLFFVIPSPSQTTYNLEFQWKPIIRTFSVGSIFNRIGVRDRRTTEWFHLTPVVGTIRFALYLVVNHLENHSTKLACVRPQLSGNRAVAHICLPALGGASICPESHIGQASEGDQLILCNPILLFIVVPFTIWWLWHHDQLRASSTMYFISATSCPTLHLHWPQELSVYRGRFQWPLHSMQSFSYTVSKPQ